MHPKRVDANQPEIVKALRDVGCSVQHLHALGKGCPDLLVGYMGKNYLMEIKDGSKPPSKRKLTEDEVEWYESWRGSLYVVGNVTEALLVVGIEQG